MVTRGGGVGDVVLVCWGLLHGGTWHQRDLVGVPRVASANLEHLFPAMDHAPDPLQQGQAQNPVVLLVFQHVKGGENVLAFELDRAQVGGDVH